MKRTFYFVIYCIAAIANFWPVVILAMSTAFGGVREYSILFLLPFAAEILSIVLLAIGASALLAKREIPQMLLLSGPILSIATVAFLGFGSFRDSAGNLALVLPETISSFAALVVGIFATKPKTIEGATPWPQ